MSAEKNNHVGYEVHKEKDKKFVLLRATAYPQGYSMLKDLEAV